MIRKTSIGSKSKTLQNPIGNLSFGKIEGATWLRGFYEAKSRQRFSVKEINHKEEDNPKAAVL